MPLLFGLEPTDPATIGLAVLVLFAVSALAGYLPAHRAATNDERPNVERQRSRLSRYHPRR